MLGCGDTRTRPSKPSVCIHLVGTRVLVPTLALLRPTLIVSHSLPAVVPEPGPEELPSPGSNPPPSAGGDARAAGGSSEAEAELNAV